MSIIKERIKFDNKDIILKVNLGGITNLTGYQQEIDELTEDTKEELINDVIDNEVNRFKLDSSIGTTQIEFRFGTTLQFASFNSAGFSSTDILSSGNKLLNSFFIMDFYDTFNGNTQTKLFTIYNTKILDGQISSFIPIPIYTVNNSNQFYYWYVPKSYINEQTGSTVTAYAKFSFYNADTGKIALFYNNDNIGLSTPEKMYFKVTLNLTAMTWQYKPYPVIMKAYEISRTGSYAQKINDTLENLENIEQNPATGAFDPEDGTYES